MNACRRILRATFAVALLVTVSGIASGHTRSESYSNWRLDANGAVGVVTVSSGEIITLMDTTAPQRLEALFLQHVANTTTVQAGDTMCQARPPLALDAARGFLRAELAFDCGDNEPTSISYRALFDVLPAHVHFMRVHVDGLRIAEDVVTARSAPWVRDGAADRQSFTAFFDLGVGHILSGIDHIAFLAGLLLVAGSLGRSIAAVTGFTIGHSLSLAMAVLGYLQADGRLVEAFIGFTVALVAVEYYLRHRPEDGWLGVSVAMLAVIGGLGGILVGSIDTTAMATYAGFGVFALCYLRASAILSQRGGGCADLVLLVVTTCFGLVHGFGFAGFLMDSGVGGSELVIPLLGFNLGVEAGQLGLLALAFIVARALRDTDAYRLAPVGAAALCGIGVFWFVGRSLAT